MNDDDLDNRFRHHPAGPNRVEQHQTIRESCRALAEDFAILLPDGREAALAVTKVEEAMFWANAAIARQPVEPVVEAAAPVTFRLPDGFANWASIGEATSALLNVNAALDGLRQMGSATAAAFTDPEPQPGAMGVRVRTEHGDITHDAGTTFTRDIDGNLVVVNKAGDCVATYACGATGVYVVVPVEAA